MNIKKVMAIGLKSLSVAAVSFGISSVAHAQDDTGFLEEITVTAQKSEQSLQEVPIAVSVLGQDNIENAFASNNLESLTTLVPSVSFRKGSTNANSAITVRGIGTISFSDAAEPSVATVVDGVVLGRSGQAFGDLYDIERIEVLRGPQGTLFGKNASAGVVNIITRAPNTDRLEGYVSVSAFEDDEYQLKGRISGPISEKLAGSINVSVADFDGFILNEFNGEDVNGYDREGIRGQLLWQPSDSLSITFTAETTESEDDCCADIPAIAANDDRFAGSAAAPGGLGVVDDGVGRPFADIQLDTRTIDQDFETRTINEFDSLSFNLVNEFASGHTLSVIGSRREWLNTEFREGDFTSNGGQAAIPVFTVSQAIAPFLLHDVGTRDNEQTSLEVRIQSPSDSRINYQVGGYYFDLQIDSDFTRDASCQNNTGQSQPILDANPGLTCNANDIVSATNFAVVDFDNLALFGDVNFDVANGVNLFFGGRFTDDTVNFTNTRVNNDPFGRQGVGVRADLPTNQFPFASGGFAIPNTDVPTGEFDADGNPILVDVPAFTGETDDTDFSIRAGVNLDIGALGGNDANLGNAYFLYSEGYKGPAFNVFFNQGTADTVPIGAETSEQFEIGYKLSRANWQFNIAVYDTEIDGFQANAFDTSTGVTITRLTNAGAVSTRGVEVDAAWAINEYLTFTGSFAVNEAEIEAFNSPLDPTTGLPEFAGGVFTGEDLLFSPDFNFTLGLNFQYPVSDTTQFFLNTTYSRVDEQESFLPGGNPDPTVNPFPIPAVGLLPEYDLWDLSLGLSFNETYRVTLIAKNLLDESFVTTNSGDQFRLQIPREADRFFGVNFRADF